MRLHNEELHNLYDSPNIIRVIKSMRMRCTEHVARIEETSNAYNILVGKPEGKRPLRRPRRRWEDIKMDLGKIGGRNFGLYSFGSGYGRVASPHIRGNENSSSVKGG
jgi:hypothetical protein